MKVFLIDFAKEKGMVIKSTYFERKDIHKGTWRSPDGSYTNQIDHVLVEKYKEKFITNVRSYRGPDADTDHFLVGIKMKQEIPDERNKRRRNGRTKQTSLGREENREAYRIELRENCQELQIGSDINQKKENREAYRIELRENCQELQIGSDIEESWAVLRDKLLESAQPFEMRNNRHGRC
ncbi:hypothetical protein QE152_g1762 [Popillia japonica]|uniref:Craniofacial development protein 2-like n=1 Tax=Popillia japonica TaxID=7064 RepID=A0AAW1N571_POPJA